MAKEAVFTMKLEPELRAAFIAEAAAARLANHPKLGRPGKIPGTRELIPHEDYRLANEIEGDTVWVLALVHTARQWPPIRSV